MWLSLQGEKIAITIRRNGDIVRQSTGERIAFYYKTDTGYMIRGMNIIVTATTRQDAILLWADVLNREKQQCGLCRKIGEGMRYSKSLGWDLCRECDQPGKLFQRSKQKWTKGCS